MTIEKVAIALSQWRKDINLGKPEWESLPPTVKDAYCEQAEAAIEAYEQAKKPDTALVQKLVKYADHTYHCPASHCFENDCTCKLHESLTEANAWLLQQKERGE